MAEKRSEPCVPDQLGETHIVFNQPPPLENYNMYDSDVPLQEAVRRGGAEWAAERLRTYGALAGGKMLEWGFPANIYPPVFHSHDRYGYWINEVRYHEAYHRLMETAIAHEVPALPWKEDRKGAHVARAALAYLHNQAETGTACPLTMTFAGVPTLQMAPDIAREWLPAVLSTTYDPRDVPFWEKQGRTIGMAMTEKQGGSDVRANTTRAYPLGGSEYELVGHKWFCSAPMSDAFLVLAQTAAGLTCFLLPRWRPDGTRNQMVIQRLKDKLGNRTNASSEVEYRRAFAWRVGEEGRGVRTIIEMVMLTRYDCMIGSSAQMRQALVQALHHCAHRKAFGKLLIEQPLMQNVLADLAVESEAALALTMRAARALDAAAADERERLFLRVATAVGKYWICKRTPMMVNEAAECLGGAGYVEESILPRLYREAPLNSIWEGSGNVQCLDVLRAMAKTPAALDAFLSEVRQVKGADRRLDQFISEMETALADRSELEYCARRVVEKMALALQGALLVQNGPPAVAEAFCAARLSGSAGRAFGTLPPGTDVHAIIRRARPDL